VEIEIPWDTLSEVDDVEVLASAPVEPLGASPESVRRAAGALVASSRPLIWAGGGATSSGASESLPRLAEYLQAPVATTSEGKGVISDRHYLSLGAGAWRRDEVEELLESSDVVLAVGTRLSRVGIKEGQQVVQIDVDAEEVGRRNANTIGVVGDTRRTLDELYDVLSGMTPQRASRRDEIEAVRRARFAGSPGPEPQASFVAAIRAAMPDDGFVVEGLTQIGYAARSLYPVYVPGTYITSSYYGNLGYAYPTALGVKVAQPHRAVAAISGDGGFLFNSQELATAVKYGINAVVIVFNDNAYGNVLRDQKALFNGRAIGSELHNPDFVKLAEAYGARGVRVVGPERLEAALREALATDAPTLIEVPVGAMPSPWD
jgi:acetolactate synthase-1/2/3 large subunit